MNIFNTNHNFIKIQHHFTNLNNNNNDYNKNMKIVKKIVRK